MFGHGVKPSYLVAEAPVYTACRDPWRFAHLILICAVGWAMPSPHPACSPFDVVCSVFMSCLVLMLAENAGKLIGSGSRAG